MRTPNLGLTLFTLLGAALSSCAQPTPPGTALDGQAVSGAFNRWNMTWTPSTWKNGDPLFGCTFAKANVTLGSGGDSAVYGWVDSTSCTEIKSNRYKTSGSAFGGDVFVPDIAGTTTTVFAFAPDFTTVWNEIDAEFVPGRGLHPALIYQNGGARYIFEAWRPAAAGRWHQIKVDWQANTIKWYLDGTLTFTMNRDTTRKLGSTALFTTTGTSMQIPAAAWPTRSLQLIANVWRGSNDQASRNFLGTYGGGKGNAIWNNLY